MIAISAILSVIANGEALIKGIWDAYNSSSMVQAKVAQMTEDEKKAHDDVLDKAMHGTVEERQAALLELQKLTSE